MRRRIPLILVLALSCESSSPLPASDLDASADAKLDASPAIEEDAAIPCGASGVSKGPWVLAMTATSVKVRWEACRKGAAPGLTFTPEAGGHSAQAPSVAAPFEVTNTYGAALNPGAPRDVAGTYYMHEVPLSGLSPSTCYRYALTADPSAAGRFCTSRRPGDPVRFMAIGDTNPTLGDSTANVLRSALPRNPDFVLHGGDIQYYDSTLETWAAWFPIMAPMLRQGAFLAAIGNHESEKPDEFEQYTRRFFGGSGEGNDSYYRFESGGIAFFALDTEQKLTPGSAQATWLSGSLADASAKPGYRFSVVYLHRPLVTCGDSGQDDAARRYFAPIFARHKVPLVFQAHMHGYERFDLDGITYVTSAGGGGRMGDVNENVARPECASRKASGPFFHAVIVDVGPGSLTGVAIDDRGATRDTFQLTVP